jgi:uncharacterized protein
LWLRGGFPRSFLARSEAASLRWRQDFVRTYLERDLLFFARRIASDALRRFWTMLAHHQGGLFNAAELSRSLDIDTKTVNRYLDLLVDLMLVRRLEPWIENLGKRLIKAPKVYLRDSGLLHALAQINDHDALLGNRLCGPSFEGWAIENLISAAGALSKPYFYRSVAGAEIDLVINLPNGNRWAIEIKHSDSPKISRGFHHAVSDLKPDRAWVVYSGTEQYRLSEQIEAIGLSQLCQRLRAVR